MERKVSVKKEKASARKSSPAGPKVKRAAKANGLSPKRDGSSRKEYVYHKLKDLLGEEMDRINIYGVVLDCSGTYYMDKPEKYVCTVKLIDDTLNPTNSSDGTPEYLTATLFARTRDQLPQPAKIGSILRIHRAQTKKNKGTFQINCDVNIKSAWTLFDPTESVAPIERSSKGYTFTPKDKATLKKIREFANGYFQKNELAGISFKKAEKERPRDFDVVCYVLDIKAKGDTTRILLCDKEKVVKLYLPPTRKLYFGPLMVVRLRSANYEGYGSFSHMQFSEYSNIMKVPNEYKSAKELLDVFKSKKASTEVAEQLQYYSHDPKEPVILSHPMKKFKVSRLRELYSGTLTKSKEKYFRIQANVIEVGPKDPKDWLCVMDKVTKKTYKLKDVLDKKKNLPENYEYYLKLQLFVKDRSVDSDNNLYMVFLCTVDGKGKEFIKVPTGRKEPDQDYWKGLKRIYRMLTRPWATLDCLVEAVDTPGGQPIFFLADTELDLK